MTSAPTPPPQAPPPRRQRWMRLTVGWILTVTGAILGPMPVVPGFLLLVPGIAILAAESRWIRSLLRRHREKKLMRDALREAERVGLKINLDHDPEVDGVSDEHPPDPGKGTGR